MLGVIGIVLFVIAAYLIFNMVGGLLGLLIAMVVAGVIGFTAEALVPGDRMPGGWLAAMGAGLVGSWAGVKLFGLFGPVISGFPIFPAILGAVVVVVVVTLLSRGQSRS